jgi:L-asparagine transporter-like permease
MPSEYQHVPARPASLEEETRTVIEEARMVLPGIQALFGFQLIAVFNNRFQDLTHTEQLLHLIALLLLAVSIALIMTPAAYHRIAERGMVSRRFVELASRFLECAMLPLMLSITIDLFLLTRFILDNSTLSAAVGVVTILMFISLWYLFPWTQKLRTRRRHGGSPRA